MVEIDLGVIHHFSAGVYAKQMLLPAKHFAVSHAHIHDHLSILATGSVTVEVQGVRKEYTAPACITILAGEHHTITAHEDSVWFCIHATDETDAANVDNVLISRGV
jgi:quercetin dioxygenase-like cupin family protein